MGNLPPIEILAAEDEETDAFFLEQAFEQLEYKSNLHIVRDGQEVMEYLGRCVEDGAAPLPHIIFLDINMPRKNGHETLEEIKAHDTFRHIPVIMFSGSKAEDDVKRCYDNNACAYVPKAKSFGEMMEIVSRIEKFWFESVILPQG